MPEPIHVLTVEVAEEAVEHVGERLCELWRQAPVSLHRPHSPRAWLECYFDSAAAAALAQTVSASVPGVRSCRVSVTDAGAWQAAFRKQFQPLLVGRCLRVAPVWERDRIPPLAERVTVWIDPGLSFGTGRHFTTAFCLEMMDGLWLNSPPASMADIGTGSGLLAVAAARLGCPRVLAIENDESILEVARANIERNEVETSVELRVADLRETRIPGRFDLVCANLISGLLVECAPELVRATAGHLVLSGIRDVEADGVADAFQACGARETVRDGEGEWVGLMFETGPNPAARKMEP